MTEILMNICIAAVITVVFKMILPDERNNHQIKLLLSCFFIIVIFNNIRGNADSFSLDSFSTINTEYNDYSASAYQQTVEEVEYQLKKRISERLLAENIIPENIYIDINISEDSSISFNEIRLVFNDISSESAERAVVITQECVDNEIKVSLEEL